MDNKKLEKMLEQMKAKGQGNSEHSQEFMDLLKASSVVVPAVMPKNTNPEIMRQMLQNPGKEQAIPEGAHPQPCILENEKKQKFLAVFTSEEEMRKSSKAPKFPLTLNMPFQSCMELLKKSPEIVGAVINPFTHNVIFQLNKKEKPQSVQVTLEQFHILTRQKMESFYLPKNLFEKKGEMITKLSTNQGECMKELYEELYTTEVACPYVPEDFEFMCLNISEDLLLIQITMPPKNIAKNTCPSVFCAWNRKEDKIWYYAIVNGGPDTENHLHQLLEDGKDVDLGVAPSEGSELSTVLDLIQNP